MATLAAAPAVLPEPAAPAQSWAEWARGRAQWALYLGMGVAFAIPSALGLLAGLLWSPSKVLRRVDRSQRRFPDPLPGLLHEQVEANGVSLHLVRTSKGSGRPLMLCVHGFPEFWYSWRHVMREFRDTHEVVAVDLRGYNESERPAGRDAYTLRKLVGDVVAVEEHLLAEAGQKQLLLVGHDWGGNLVWTAAHFRPDLLSGLVVMCCPHPLCFMKNMDWDQLRRSWYIFVFQLPWLAEALLRANDYAILQAMLAKPPMGLINAEISEEEVERYKQAFGRPGAPTAAVNYYRNLLPGATYKPDPVMTAALRRKLEVPTLLLWAEQDVALGPQLLRGTERHLERLRMHTVPNCSHWVQQDRPEEVHRLMKEFLAGQAQRA